jgi:hypothetical protein
VQPGPSNQDFALYARYSWAYSICSFQAVAIPCGAIIMSVTSILWMLHPFGRDNSLEYLLPCWLFRTFYLVGHTLDGLLCWFGAGYW